MPIIQNGQGLEIAVPPGQSIAVASLTGTYSATLLDGAGRGVLASASAGGATYGPYPAGATIRVSAGIDSCVAYDVGVQPDASVEASAKVETDARGDVAALVGLGGSAVSLGRRTKASRGVSPGADWLTIASGWGADGSGTIAQGAAGLTLTKTSASGYILARRYGESIKLRADSVITLEADLIGVTAGTVLRIELSSDGFVNKSMLLEHIVKAAHGGRIRISFPASSATLNGGELVTNTMTYVGIRLADAAAAASIKVTALKLNAVDRPRLIIDLDDGFVSQYTEAFRWMNASDLVGNIAVIGSEVGNASYVTKTQLDAMYAAGWDLMTHGFNTHAQINSESGVQADVQANLAYLLDNGFDRAAYHYVYPGGVVMPYSRTVLASLDMQTARIVDQNLTPTDAGFTYPESTGLWSYDISQNRGVSSLLASVDLAIAAGASIRLHGHRVVDTVVDADNEMTVADFKTLCAGLRERVRDRLIDNVTISQWWALVS